MVDIDSQVNDAVRFPSKVHIRERAYLGWCQDRERPSQAPWCRKCSSRTGASCKTPRRSWTGWRQGYHGLLPALLPFLFLGGKAPPNIDYRKKGGTLVLTSQIWRTSLEKRAHRFGSGQRSSGVPRGPLGDPWPLSEL